MAIDFARAFGGFAGGLAQGIQEGTQLAQRQQQIELQQQEFKLKLATAVDALPRMKPEVRKAVGPGIFQAWKKVAGDDASPQWFEKIITHGNDAEVQAAANVVARFISTSGADRAKIVEEMKALGNDPAKIIQFGQAMSTMMHQREQEKTSRMSVGVAASSPERVAFGAAYQENLSKGMSKAEAAQKAYSSLSRADASLEKLMAADWMKQNPGKSLTDYAKYRAESGFRPTALQTNSRYLAGLLKIPEDEAARRLTESRGKSDQELYADGIRHFRRTDPGSTLQDAQKFARDYVASVRRFSTDSGAAPERGATPKTAPQGGEPLPFTPEGKLDPKRLRNGSIYTSPDGKRGRWTGKDFEEVK